MIKTACSAADISGVTHGSEAAVAKTAIGLSITPSSVRAAQVRVDSKSATIMALAEQPLYGGVVTSGGVADPAQLSNALRTMWSAFKLKGKDVVLGVGGQRVAVRTAEMPWMPPKDIRSALPLYIGEVVPFDVNDAVLDYVISGETVDEEGERTYTGIVAAAPEEYLCEFVDAVQLAGLTVTSIDVDSFALIRAVVPPIPPGYLVAEALVHVGQQNTQVVVHVNARPALVRDLPLGAGNIGADMTPGYGMPPGAARPGGMAQVNIDPLAEEILTTIGYYQAGDDAMPLQRVLLVGSGSQVPGLDLAISSGVNLPVAHDAAWLSLPRDSHGASDEVIRAVGASMAIPVGLGLGVGV